MVNHSGKYVFVNDMLMCRAMWCGYVCGVHDMV